MPRRPHHDGSPLYVSTQSPALGEAVVLRLRVPHDDRPVASVRVLAHPDHEPEWTPARSLGVDHAWEWWEASITVRNPRHGYRWLIVRGDGGVQWVNQSGVHDIETRDADDFALVTHPAPPAWMTDAVMYQIFPDRFARSVHADSRAAPDWATPASWSDPVDPVLPGRSQQWYGGDLDGITERLDHLVNLGVNLLYLTPFFPAASNHRYDAARFDEVDPLLGGDEALIRLIEAAHRRGIRVIGDLTTNHSGDRHEWFRAALGSPEAPESDFYLFTDPDNTTYESWLGTPSLPKFNWGSAELRRRFIEGPDSVVAKWLSPPFDADGWRIDVANMTGRLGEVDLNADVRQTLRRTMIEVNPDTLLIAEITNDASQDLTGDAWHGAMTYPSFARPLWGWLCTPSEEPYLTAEGAMRTEPWFFGQPLGGIPRYTGRQFVDAVERFTAGIPWRVRLGNMQTLDSHDTARFATHARPEVVPVAVGLSMTLPGLPVLFAGDEFGLTGADGETSRTPMPWGTESEPETALRLDLYRDLIRLRRTHPALATGGLRWLHRGDDAIAFVREHPHEAVLVLASRAAARVVLEPGDLLEPAGARRVFGPAELAVGDDGAVELQSAGAAFSAWALPRVEVPRAGGVAAHASL
ncbi:glycoside hydrolase family 13 protein [Microbacterium xanthum]|uniref:glycoside hydrolase family 13 protein n=1 Tax=Microbacterium xanthum TaxID=3079794 RepID=UPI002AD39ED9|nr:glycoside hydrolase family 13 protein [Microbacterium sp. KSW-48]MDZ8172029.1 glycoside hydrolase family 13 protein [Microbacterium sp. KSW-48]